VLSGDAYVVGQSLLQVMSALAQLGGMALGGIAVATIGPQRALLLCAACHLVAAVVSRLRLPDLPGGSRAGRSVVGQSWRGNRRLLADRRVRTLLMIMWLPPMFVTGAEALLVPYAERRGYPPGTAGLLLACLPVGMIVGDLLIARLVRPATRERLVPALIATMGLSVAALALHIGPVAGGVAQFLAGCSYAYALGLQRAFLDAVPADARGQAFALRSTGLMTLQGVGPVGLGLLAEVVPVETAIGAAGLAVVAIALGQGWRANRIR
jgi:predicted MFS family arabinose efflux permease